MSPSLRAMAGCKSQTGIPVTFSEEHYKIFISDCVLIVSICYAGVPFCRILKCIKPEAPRFVFQETVCGDYRPLSHSWVSLSHIEAEKIRKDGNPANFLRPAAREESKNNQLSSCSSSISPLLPHQSCATKLTVFSHATVSESKVLGN